jgi:hypothetical protein
VSLEEFATSLKHHVFLEDRSATVTHIEPAQQMDQSTMDDELLALALQLEEAEGVNLPGNDANVALSAFREEIAAGFTFRSDRMLARNIDAGFDAEHAVRIEIQRANALAERHKNVAKQIKTGAQTSERAGRKRNIEAVSDTNDAVRIENPRDNATVERHTHITKRIKTGHQTWEEAGDERNDSDDVEDGEIEEVEHLEQDEEQQDQGQEEESSICKAALLPKT